MPLSAYIDSFRLARRRDPASTEWLRENARVEGNTADRGPEISLTVLYGTGTKVAAKMPANVVDFRPLDKGDVALLKVEKHNMPSSELATDADVNIGTPILAVGFPETTQGSPVLRWIHEQERQGQQKSTMRTIPEYEIDAAVSEGMSGGPTIELNGKVIGVNSFGPAGEPQAFNFIAPADGLAAYWQARLSSRCSDPPTVLPQRARRLLLGHYSDAIKDFDQAWRCHPTIPGWRI